MCPGDCQESPHGAACSWDSQALLEGHVPTQSCGTCYPHGRIQPVDQDLSHKVSAKVHQLRRCFDRHPADHKDMEWWSWRFDQEPPTIVWHRNPRQVPHKPQGALAPRARTGPEIEPLRPPNPGRTCHEKAPHKRLVLIRAAS